MTTSVTTETHEAYTTTIRVPIERALPTAAITDMETNTRGDMVAPVETVRVTKMVTVLACPAEYDTQKQ